MQTPIQSTRKLWAVLFICLISTGAYSQQLATNYPKAVTETIKKSSGP